MKKYPGINPWVCLLGVCLLAFTLLLPAATGQKRSRAALERRKQERLRRIAEAERILSSKRSTKEATIGQLSTLSKEIEDHEGLVASYSASLSYVQEGINETNQVILGLESDLSTLRQEYAQMVNWAYKNRQGINQLTFLFSSENFRQFFLRLKYLSHYAEQRRIQLEAIQKVKRTLNVQSKELSLQRKQQEQLLREQQERRARLLRLQKEKRGLIKELESQSDRLRKELKADRVALKRMDRLIKELIAKERSTARSAGAGTRIDALFAQNKRRLPWPVPRGIISSKFGTQYHPVFKGIKQENGGIEIQTAGSLPVRAVFEGIVTEVAWVPGMNYVVIIQHGNYRSVYARLSQVSVSKGEHINGMQIFAKVNEDAQGSTALHFEIWKNFDKMDPEKWLRRQ